jgi:isopentenyl phosphate kinase
MNRLAKEISNSNVENLIVVHGGGSFGHPLAKKYALNEGLKECSQKIGFSETHHVMTVLNGLFMDSLVWHNIPAVSVTPSSCMLTQNGRVNHFEDVPLKMLLKIGFLPVLYGDAVLDTEMGVAILSGDQLISVLALRLNAERVIVGIDEDGLYDADPKAGKGAKMFGHLTLAELKELQSKLGEPRTCDVTGGMLGKVAELLLIAEHRVPITIVNGTKSSYVYRALRKEKVIGTVIERE